MDAGDACRKWRGGVLAYGNVCVQRGVQLRSEDDVTETLTARNRCRKKRQWRKSVCPTDENVLRAHAGSPGSADATPDKSLALLTWTLCLNVFGSGRTVNQHKSAWNVNIIR